MGLVDQQHLEIMAEIALAAGAVIMPHFGIATASYKQDGSPVTNADAEAEAIILPALERLFPNVPIIAEEAVSAGIIPETGIRFLLVDPLDGTKEFIAGSGEFTVNIALVENGVPVGGVIFAPVLKKLWIGGKSAAMCDVSPGSGLESARNWQKLTVRKPPDTGLAAVASRSHMTPETEAYLARLPIAERRSAGSSIKFCLLAQGLADVYPRFGPTMEWDTAAGHAILLAAGGEVCTDAGTPFLYGKRENGYRNSGFIAASSLKVLEELARAKAASG